MAGIGSRMDPEGPGGYIGEPTIEMIEAKAAAAAAEKQSQQMEALIKALGDLGGEIKIGRDGEMSIKSYGVTDGKEQRGLGTLGTLKPNPSEQRATEPSTSQPAPAEDPRQNIMGYYEQMFKEMERIFGGL
jgi:hypothetical protein